jgi:CBS domain-containing protein
MLCTQLMKKQVSFVTPQSTVQRAAQLMREQNVGFLPVCDGNRQVLGAITDRDIAIRLVAEGLDCDVPVSEVMSDEVLACRPWDDIRRAESLMGIYQKSRIIVLDQGGALSGVISLSDIAEIEEGRAIQVLREVAHRETHA